MIDKFKRLARSSLIYGAGNYGVKLVGFLLIPVYTRYLTPADYGVMSLISTLGQILFVFLNLGQSSALFRFYYEDDSPQARQRVIAGSLTVSLFFSLPLTLAVLAVSQPIARLLLGEGALYPLVVVGVLTVAARQLLRLPFAVLRAEERDTRYATWSVIRTGLSASLAILLVVGLEMGVRGVLLSSLLAEALLCLVLVPSIAGALRTGFAGREMRDQLRFGLALVPGGVAAFVLDLSDRFFLKHYASLEEVGLYSLGYRFGEIVFFVVAAVQLAWPQFVFMNRRAERAPELYAYATTYYVGGMLFVILALSALAPELIGLMAAPAFHAAAVVVPLIALSGLCEGLCYVGTIGIMFQRRPIIRSAAVIASACLNIGLNFLLIPRFGMLGAAFATLVAFAAQVVMLVTVALRFYPIPYQWGRFARLAGVATALYAASALLPPGAPAVTAALKLGLLAAFPGLLWLLGFFEPAELAHVQRVRAGLIKRLAPSRA